MFSWYGLILQMAHSLPAVSLVYSLGWYLGSRPANRLRTWLFWALFLVCWLLLALFEPLIPRGWFVFFALGVTAVVVLATNGVAGVQKRAPVRLNRLMIIALPCPALLIAIVTTTNAVLNLGGTRSGNEPTQWLMIISGALAAGSAGLLALGVCLVFFPRRRVPVQLVLASAALLWAVTWLIAVPWLQPIVLNHLGRPSIAVLLLPKEATPLAWLAAAVWGAVLFLYRRIPSQSRSAPLEQFDAAVAEAPLRGPTNPSAIERPPSKAHVILANIASGGIFVAWFGFLIGFPILKKIESDRRKAQEEAVSVLPAGVEDNYRAHMQAEIARKVRFIEGGMLVQVRLLTEAPVVGEEGEIDEYEATRFVPAGSHFFLQCGLDVEAVFLVDENQATHDPISLDFIADEDSAPPPPEMGVARGSIAARRLRSALCSDAHRYLEAHGYVYVPIPQ